MKKQTTSILFGSIATAMCLSGCQSLYYAPNAQNVPMFKEKNEVRASASFCDMSSVESEVTGIEIQSAYAAGKHFAIMINGFKAVSNKTSDTNDVEENQQKTSLFELGAGYFKPFSGDKLVVEAYGGFGFGEYKNHYADAFDPSVIVNSNVQFKRLFVQPSIGYSSPYFGAAFSLRLAMLMYDQKPESYLGTSYFLAEPCFTFRAGWKGLKIQSQLLFSNNITDPGFPQQQINFNTGLYLALPVKKTTK